MANGFEDMKGPSNRVMLELCAARVADFKRQIEGLDAFIRAAKHQADERDAANAEALCDAIYTASSAARRFDRHISEKVGDMDPDIIPGVTRSVQ